MSVVVDEAKVGGYAVGTEDANTVRIVGTDDGREYTVEALDSVRVTTVDAGGREHRASRVFDWGGRGYQALAGAVDQVRTAAISAELVDEAAAEVGGPGRVDITGADFLLDHEQYGDIWSLLVEGGEDGYVIGYNIDQRTDQMTAEVVVMDSGDVEPVSPQLQAEVLERATGMAHPQKAAEYAEQVASLAMKRYREQMAG